MPEADFLPCRAGRRRAGSFLAALVFFAFFLPAGEGSVFSAEKKITVGLVEEVVLLPWGVKLPARIDTGAALSSLDARDLKIEGDWARFRLPEKFGGLALRLPIVGWKSIRSAESQERRPVVEMEFCLGSRVVRARINLNDRSKVSYPLLVGRNALRKNYVVDCMKKFCAPPSCPQVPSP